MENPSDRKYTNEHEWCKPEGNHVVVGITDYAQHSLTDIVFIELPKIGQKLEKGKPMCSVESVKSVSDVFAPVSGEVVEVNPEVEKSPELLNRDPFGKGWIAKLKIDSIEELESLMDSKQYTAFTEGKEKKE
ncbi:MAG: glycine cleavage system protein GcvH [Candidatus Diapherotrites archaeon]|uniref:Probable glycine cleavage system H protein n=1 Tax=Candidatus Iainarchaeum sp. TaxID=3101447 RepID=A0A938YRY9_9ARCH|nr:glycine cleavage system protein GcvH [Candidatus Diapherotrites archaeon]